MRKNDYMLAIFVLCASFLFYWFKPAETDSYLIQVQHQKAILHTIRQAELQARGSMQFVVETEHGHVLVDLDSKKGMAVLASPCPDQDCVKQPRITRAGQSTLCLPEEILITLLPAKKEGAVDAILR